MFYNLTQHPLFYFATSSIFNPRKFVFTTCTIFDLRTQFCFPRSVIPCRFRQFLWDSFEFYLLVSDLSLFEVIRSLTMCIEAFLIVICLFARRENLGRDTKLKCLNVECVPSNLFRIEPVILLLFFSFLFFL